MHQPASVGGVVLPTDPLEALKLYSSLGLRCFPATYLDKTPHPRVGKGWDTLPVVRPAMWDKLTAGWGRFNVALIADEHLVIIDLDNLDFVSWFDAQGPERLGTWIVRSPSGGLHVYVRTDDPQRTTVIKATSGVKIGDVKAWGGYVIAPPSVGSNGDYQTEYGSPDAITRQANAITWFSGFVQAWERTQPVRLQPTVSANDQQAYGDADVHGPPPPSRQEELKGMLRTAWMSGSLNRKVYDTLKEGVDAADGYWKNASDRSDVDFGCIKELINVGWGFPEIEELWTFSPVGERYRDTSARNHGHGYMLRTFDSAKRKWDMEQADLMVAEQPDWKIMHGVETWEEGRVHYYAFNLMTKANGLVHQIEIDGRALASVRDFTRALYARGVFVDLGNFSDAKGLRALGQIITRLAVARPKPETATREGHLRDRIRVVIHTLIMPKVATHATDLLDWIAWSDGSFVYVDPHRLHRQLRYAVSPSPTEAEVWREWRALDGDESQWPQVTNCWRAPRSSFPDLQLS